MSSKINWNNFTWQIFEITFAKKNSNPNINRLRLAGSLLTLRLLSCIWSGFSMGFKQVALNLRKSFRESISLKLFEMWQKHESQSHKKAPERCWECEITSSNRTHYVINTHKSHSMHQSCQLCRLKHAVGVEKCYTSTPTPKLKAFNLLSPDEKWFFHLLLTEAIVCPFLLLCSACSYTRVCSSTKHHGNAIRAAPVSQGFLARPHPPGPVSFRKIWA